MKKLSEYLTESDTPFKQSKIKDIVYRCGDKELSNDNFVDIVWFSDKPIERFGKMSRYYIDIKKPFVVDCGGNGWCDKLWYICCNDDATPKMEPNDPKLLKMIPSADIWKMVQESDVEYEWGDIPYIVQQDSKLRNRYDAVILKDIYETEACNIKVTDYCVFSMDQIAQAG